MRLFDMTEADIPRAEDAYCDRLFDIYYEADRPEPCCGNCQYYTGSECCLCEWDDDVTDYRTVEDDDYCDNYRREEDD